VLWSEDGSPARPGRLDVSRGGLALAGGSKLEPERREIPLAAICSVRIGRRLHERLAGRAALVLSLRDGATLAISSLSGAGTLHELAERLWALVGPSPEAEPAPEPNAV